MEPFGVHSESRIRHSVSHSMSSREGWDKVVISKHHTQERKGIGTPGVGSYSISPRRSMSTRSVVIRMPCSSRSPSPSSRSWLPLQSIRPPTEQNLKITGVSFPRAPRKLGHVGTNSAVDLSPLSGSGHVNFPSPRSSRQRRPLHLLPSCQKSSPVSGLFMPVFARHSRSVSFSRATRQPSPRSVSPRFSPWSSDARQASLYRQRAPKFGSPRTRPRLDFRRLLN